jgi:hypothetical protein
MTVLDPLVLRWHPWGRAYEQVTRHEAEKAIASTITIGSIRWLVFL